MDEVKSRPYNTRNPKRGTKSFRELAGYKSKKSVKAKAPTNTELLNIYTKAMGRAGATKKFKGNKYLAKAKSRRATNTNKRRFGFAAKEAKGRILNAELLKVEKELKKEEAAAKRQTRAQAQARAKEYTRAKAQAATIAKAQALRERAAEVMAAAGVNASAAYESRGVVHPGYALASLPVGPNSPLVVNDDPDVNVLSSAFRATRF